MQASEIARKLGISTQAISLWVREFADYFSESAKVRRGRIYTVDDLDIFCTIAKLSRSDGLGYDQIRARLQVGERHEYNNVAVIDASPVVSESAARHVADTAKIAAQLDFIRSERDKLQSEVDQLRTALDTERASHNETVQALQDRIAALSLELGQAQGRLAEKDKRWRWFG